MAVSKVTFKTNVTQTLAFPFGDAKEKESQLYDSVQYLYAVELDRKGGDKSWLYATERLHELLQDAEGFGKGAVVEITKVEMDGNRKDWQVDVVVAGKPVREAAQKAPRPAKQSAEAPQAAPGDEEPEKRLSTVRSSPSEDTAGSPVGLVIDQLGELFEACLHRSTVIHARNFDGDVDADSVRRLANTLFIQVTRFGFYQLDETQGMTALRKLVQRIDADPRYADIAKSFDLHPLPANGADQAMLYGQLREAIALVDQTAAPPPVDDEFPPEPPEGTWDDEFPPEPKPAKTTKPAKPAKTTKGKAASADGRDADDPIADGKATRIRILAREAFGDDDGDDIQMFLTEELGRPVMSVDQVRDAEALGVIAALKRSIDSKVAA